MITGDDAGPVVEHVPDERGGGQRGVRHEQADGVRDQVAGVYGDAELGQRGVYEQRGGQESGAHHEVRAVKYLTESEASVVAAVAADGVQAAQATSDQDVRVRGRRADRPRRRHHRVHRVHAVLVPFDGHHPVVHLHPTVRQQPVTDGLRFVQYVPVPGTAVRRFHPEEIIVLTCRREL